MATVIRMRRGGAKKAPFYRLVAADSRSPRDGRFLEILGYYNPVKDPAVVSLDEEKIRAWLSKGAKPSQTVRNLLKAHGILKRHAAGDPVPEASEVSVQQEETPKAEATEPKETTEKSQTKATEVETEDKSPEVEENADEDTASETSETETEEKKDTASDTSETETEEKTDGSEAKAAE